MVLEVNRMIHFDPFLATGNNSCQYRASFCRQELLNVVFRKVLSFLIYINYLTNALEKTIAHHFADDTNLLYGNKNPSFISDVINSELKLITIWLRANEISLNESKVKLLLFRPNNKLNLTFGFNLQQPFPVVYFIWFNNLVLYISKNGFHSPKQFMRLLTFSEFENCTTVLILIF